MVKHPKAAIAKSYTPSRPEGVRKESSFRSPQKVAEVINTVRVLPDWSWHPLEKKAANLHPSRKGNGGSQPHPPLPIKSL